MKRRAILAAAGSAGAVAMAGCARLGSETISNPAEEQASDGETTLSFQADNGDQVASLTVRPAEQRFSGHGGQQIPVDIAITHPEETTITGLSLSLRAPPSGTGLAEVAIETPFGAPNPSLELYEADDGATALAIDDMGTSGDGTVLFKFLLLGVGDATSEVEVDAEIGLSETGMLSNEYTLKGLTLVSLPGGKT
ncbi:hypothetical protein [Halovenus halobia]|uniref:hypothetical protein n=1 Tax=Halovenus halobia TaxID=3396622 RepID=UPI003F55F42D